MKEKIRFYFNWIESLNEQSDEFNCFLGEDNILLNYFNITDWCYEGSGNFHINQSKEALIIIFPTIGDISYTNDYRRMNAYLRRQK